MNFLNDIYESCFKKKAFFICKAELDPIFGQFILKCVYVFIDFEIICY